MFKLPNDRPSLIDLYCCAGGAARGYQRAGFYVVGVDIKEQPNYCGDEFYKADAVEFFREYGRLFCAAHASPPCQHYSAIQHITKNKEKHPDLVAPTREALIESGLPFVIENVEGAPLRVDLMLCGSMFGLGMIRHRIFESNVTMPLLVPPCHHSNMYDPWHYGTDQRVQMSKGMGIDWFMTRQEVREAIPPAFTECIGRQLVSHLAQTSGCRTLLAPDLWESAPLQAFPTPETFATSQALPTPPTSG